MLGSEARLADRLCAGWLARVIPLERGNAAPDAHRRITQRERSFPAIAATDHTAALSLHPEASYVKVFAAIAQGVASRVRQLNA